MPVNPTYPGVYIEEIPSGVHTITGVATSITAFIGRAMRGPVNEAVTINSFADFERIFGGLWLHSKMGYAVRDFYRNGGSQAVIVRLFYPTAADVQEAKQAADEVVNVTDTTKPSTPASLAAAMRTMVESFTTKAGRNAADAVAKAAEAEATNASTPASVRKVALDTAELISKVAQAVAGATDDSASPTAQSQAAAMRTEAKKSTEDPAKTIADLVAKAAETAAGKNNATVDDVQKAAKGAADDINTVTHAVASATDSTRPSTAQSQAAAMRTEANKSTSDPQKTAADLVATAAENEAKKTPSVASVRQATQAAASNGAVPASTVSTVSVGGLSLLASSEGTWGETLRAVIDFNVLKDVADEMKLKPEDLFNLTVWEEVPGGGGRREQFRNLTVKESPLRVDKVLAAQSDLVRWGGSDAPKDDDLVKVRSRLNGHSVIEDDVTTAEDAVAEAKKKIKVGKKAGKSDTDLKSENQQLVTAQNALAQAEQAMSVLDGEDITEYEFTGTNKDAAKQGLYALEQVDLFNLLCIPPYTATSDVDIDLIAEAAAYCERRRAMLLVDPPSDWTDKERARKRFTDATTDYVGTRSKNAALFFPRLMEADPLHNQRLEEFVPSGAVAGIFARTDVERGVWKAPAGIDASLVGVPQLTVNLTDPENGELNQLGINCLRAFPIYGRVVWGSRTLRGADQFADEYKYIPVRRTALFIEESLYRGTKWVVFEPNDEPLWAQIRLNVGAFMHNLFRQGAFQGQTPRDAYLVKCDKETTTQNDIDLGIVNILVAFAPLKPAEFVIIQIQQMAGQIEV